MRSCATLVLAVLLLAAAPSAHGAGGPVIGIDSSGGIVGPGGASRYLALHGLRGDTVVARLSLPGGKLLRQRAVKGHYMTPAVAYDGSTSGGSGDATKLVLIEAQTRVPVRTTRLLVMSALPLRVERRIALRGMYGFDAISPDGSTIYLVHYTAPRRDLTRYEVRALATTTGRLVPNPIVDPRKPDEKMTGNPVTRAMSLDGRWAYTLYAGADGTPFIHALDTAGRKAYCIDLDALAAQPDIFSLRLRVQRDGRRLAVDRRDSPL